MYLVPDIEGNSVVSPLERLGLLLSQCFLSNISGYPVRGSSVVEDVPEEAVIRRATTVSTRGRST